MSLNSKLTICEDQSTILDFLVDNQELPQDFSQNMVKSVLKDGAFYLAIYKAYEKEDRFTLYRIDDLLISLMTCCIYGVFLMKNH
jgi:hypothetical protein